MFYLLVFIDSRLVGLCKKAKENRRDKKMRIILLLLSIIILQSCQSDPEKHELKSPCVSADSDGGRVIPCKRRPLAGNQIG